jgi:hypothetical protein
MARGVGDANTAQGLANAFISAAKGLPQPPTHAPIRPKDVPFWEAIVSTRLHDDWSEAQLGLASQLARLQSDIIEWRAELVRQGPILYTGRGANIRPSTNPLVAVIDLAARQQLALMRVLGLTKTKTNKQEGARKMLSVAREANAKIQARKAAGSAEGLLA